MIDKVAHRIWFSEGPDDVIPERYEEYWKRFEELHPDWELRTWNDPEQVPFASGARELFDALSGRGRASYGYRADIARYCILLEMGGVYLDTDVEVLRPLDELLQRPEPFIAWCSQKELDPSVIAGPAGHPALRELVDRLPHPMAETARWSPPGVTGPNHVTHHWRLRTDVRRLPPITFFPVHWSEPSHMDKRGPYPKESFARHHWGTGWK